MGRSIPALVKPELLVWARESAHLKMDDVAAKTKFERVVLEGWEAGEGHPSISQLRKLGEIYKRPIAVFFLQEIPRGFAPQCEFRRIAGIEPGKESPELLNVLRMAAFRREAAKEIAQLMNDVPQKISYRLSIRDNQENAGINIRKALGISWDEQVRWSNPHAALSSWREAIERLGVLVFQVSKINLNEMRGTCIPEQPFPIILLNSKDSPHGRIFTLLHEFAHILFHLGGHETSRMEGRLSPEEQPLEVASNAVAAAMLLPEMEFLKTAPQYPGAISGDDDDLRKLAQKVKASPEAILRRLVTLRKTNERIYERKRDGWKTLWYFPQKASIGGPTIEVKTVSGNGRGFTSRVLHAYDQRLISTNALSDYLGVKPKYLPKIRSVLGAPVHLA